jgi:hypothetical protein
MHALGFVFNYCKIHVKSVIYQSLFCVYFIVFCLTTISRSDYIVSDNSMIMNNESERIWKEAVVAFLRHYPSICLG